MPKTKTGQEYSESTPDKLEAFEYFMNYHLGVVECVLKRNPYYSYTYIDLNCGAGYQPDYAEFGSRIYGSPVIALQQSQTKKLDVNTTFHFVDINPAATDCLKNTLNKMQLGSTNQYLTYTLDNDLALAEIAKNITKKLGCKYKNIGLLYLDPNGNQQIPLKELKTFSVNPDFASVDILMNISATNLKRWFKNPKAKGRWGEYGLEEIIESIQKKYWFIRYPSNNMYKWTFLFGTNWAKQKALNKIRLYDIKSDIGCAIFKNLLNGKSNLLPIIQQPSHYHQLSLPLFS